MKETLLIHGPVRRCPGLVFPIHILGKKMKKHYCYCRREGWREVRSSLGGLSGVCIAFSSSLQAGRRAGRQRRQVSRIVVDCSSRWTDYMLLLPSRTSQSIFPIARETLEIERERWTHFFLSLHNSQAARLLITTLPILAQSPTSSSSSFTHSFIHSSQSSISNPFLFLLFQNCLLPAHLR